MTQHHDRCVASVSLSRDIALAIKKNVLTIQKSMAPKASSKNGDGEEDERLTHSGAILAGVFVTAIVFALLFAVVFQARKNALKKINSGGATPAFRKAKTAAARATTSMRVKALLTPR